jgi:hypothetical protein
MFKCRARSHKMQVSKNGTSRADLNIRKDVQNPHVQKTSLNVSLQTYVAPRPSARAAACVLGQSHITSHHFASLHFASLHFTSLHLLTMSNTGLTDGELELLNIARGTFSNDYIPLHDKKIAAIKKCADLVAIDPRSILRNVLKSRAHTILTDIWTYSHPEVFVLCSIATTITRLGGLKSTDYIRKLREWWDKADKPDGLRQTVKKLAKILPTKQDAAATFGKLIFLLPIITNFFQKMQFRWQQRASQNRRIEKTGSTRASIMFIR